LNAFGARRTRTDAAGDPILLLEQNRKLWDQLQMRPWAWQALGRARELGRCRRLLRPAGRHHLRVHAWGISGGTKPGLAAPIAGFL